MTNNKPIVKADDKTTNELLATEVMGMTCHRMVNNGNEWYEYHRPDSSIILLREDFSPTTDMNQAMECLQEFVSGYLYDVQITRTAYNMWRVNIDTVCEPHSLLANITNDSAPLAICKAIAKAKGIDT